METHVTAVSFEPGDLSKNGERLLPYSLGVLKVRWRNKRWGARLYVTSKSKDRSDAVHLFRLDARLLWNLASASGVHDDVRVTFCVVSEKVKQALELVVWCAWKPEPSVSLEPFLLEPSRNDLALNEQRLRGEGTDFVAERDGERWTLHKCVLAVNSRFFAAAFQNNMHDRDNMSLGEGEPIHIGKVFEWMYTRKMPSDSASVCKIFSLANLFEMEELREACVRKLTEVTEQSEHALRAPIDVRDLLNAWKAARTLPADPESERFAARIRRACAEGAMFRFIPWASCLSMEDDDPKDVGEVFLATFEPMRVTAKRKADRDDEEAERKRAKLDSPVTFQ